MESVKISPKIRNYGYRLLALLASFIAGWITYTVGVMVFPYDGIIAIAFQAVIGAVLTGIVVALSCLIGFVLRKYVPIKYLPGYRVYLIAIILCLFFLIFGYSLGLRGNYVDSETGTTFQSGNAIVGVGGYLLIIFFIANWPIKKKLAGDPHTSA